MSNETRETKARTPRGSGEGSGGVQSVDRAITVLEIIAREGSAGVSEVATEIGVHKSTAFRLLAALEERDLVEQNVDRGKYQLAFGILRLASAIPARIDMVRQAQPVMEELALHIDETINLAVVRKQYVVNVQQALGSAAVSSHNWVGQLTPIHATSSGKVLLAHMTPAQRDDLLDKAGLTAYTPQTVTSRTTLLGQLDRIRIEDYAATFEELEVGLNASATSVRDHTGTVVGALSVSGPAFRFDKARIEAVEEDVKAAAARISHRLGWPG
ncbi:MAG TPA: IclR family transcriptional regulator [Nocardioides sp.]|nr:IclR family transcriptional regulator [Nocardioides sp.]